VSSKSGKLIADAGIGVGINVANGHFEEVGSGGDLLELNVPAGLYSVQWSSPDISGEEMVRVLPGKTVTVRRPRDKSRSHEAHSSAVAAIPVQSLPQGKLGREDKSDLVVTLEAETGAPADQVLKSIQVVDIDDEFVEAFERDPQGVPTVTWHEVTPGRYRLRYLTMSGETLDQTLPILKDRRTIVRLWASYATVLAQDGENVTSSRCFGVDPARTLITTARANGTTEKLEEQMRFAQILLRDLAQGTGSLSTSFTDRLYLKGTDPLLQLYAAMVIFNCLERGISPALDDPYPEEKKLLAFRHKWSWTAYTLITNPKRIGMPPDAVVGQWQAVSWYPANKNFFETQASIQMPTMLECAWRWAVQRTTKDRNALKAFASIRAAARSAGGTSPWLCWQSAAAKAINQPTTKQPTRTHLDDLVRDVAQKVKALRMREGRDVPNFVLPNSIPSEVAAAALRSEEIVDALAKPDGPKGSPAAMLAVALTLPEAALGTKLQRTLELLDGALGEGAGAPDTDVSPKAKGAADAPGWSAKVRHKNDPNLGRFGGQAKAGGFTLNARFKPLRGGKWAAIVLSVRGKAPDGAKAIFYLHDSFRPVRQIAEFEKGAATLRVTAWGGFTVGAWIPHAGIQLELDLAKMKGAPDIIRDR